MGLEKGGVDLDDRLVRVVGKGGKERIVPLGREAAEALRRYLARGRPHLDRRHRPELFLNAKGGALTRAGAFLILRRLAAAAGLDPAARPPAPAAALVRDAPARGRRRPPQRPGDARPRRPRHDRALHARHRPRRRESYFEAHPHARRRGAEVPTPSDATSPGPAFLRSSCATFAAASRSSRSCSSSLPSAARIADRVALRRAVAERHDREPPHRLVVVARRELVQQRPHRR